MAQQAGDAAHAGTEVQVGTRGGVVQPVKHEFEVRVTRQTMTPVFAPQFDQSCGKQHVRRFPQLPFPHLQPLGQRLPAAGAQQSNMIRLVLPQLHDPQREDPDGHVLLPLSVQQKVLFASEQQVDEHEHVPMLQPTGHGSAQFGHRAESAEPG